MGNPPCLASFLRKQDTNKHLAKRELHQTLLCSSKSYRTQEKTEGQAGEIAWQPRWYVRVLGKAALCLL